MSSSGLEAFHRMDSFKRKSNYNLIVARTKAPGRSLPISPSLNKIRFNNRPSNLESAFFFRSRPSNEERVRVKERLLSSAMIRRNATPTRPAEHPHPPTRALKVHSLSPSLTTRIPIPSVIGATRASINQSFKISRTSERIGGH